jgi:hypothetical protein
MGERYMNDLNGLPYDSSDLAEKVTKEALVGTDMGIISAFSTDALSVLFIRTRKCSASVETAVDVPRLNAGFLSKLRFELVYGRKRIAREVLPWHML